MKNLNIGKKIAVVFGVVLVVACAITAIGLWQMNAVVASTRELMAAPLAKERLVSDWYRIIFGGSRRTLAIARSADSSLVKFFAEDQAQGSKEVEAVHEQGQAAADLATRRSAWWRDHEAQDVQRHARCQVAKARAADDTEPPPACSNEKFVPASKAYQAKLRELIDMQRKEIDANAQKIEAAGALSLRLQGAAVGVLALLVVGAGVLLRNSVVGPLREAIGIARRVAEGDLSATSTSTPATNPASCWRRCAT